MLYPAPVQGSGSAEKIAQAIMTANQRAECDVLIVCRGGGSIEDLWSFNEEVVARAIAASAIPVVSGVGHETDFTIADFVADERAPTPTAAAQRVVPDRRVLWQSLRDQSLHLQRAQHNRLQRNMQAVDYLQRRLVHPAQQLRQQGQRLSVLQQRLLRALSHTTQHQQWRWQSLEQRLGVAMRAAQLRQKGRVHTAAQHLAMLNPQRVLARGYSLVQDAKGGVVTDANRLAAGAMLRITFAQGVAHAEVTETSES
jgi:exodeoxyribonuclease VII large subunit